MLFLTKKFKITLFVLFNLLAYLIYSP